MKNDISQKTYKKITVKEARKLLGKKYTLQPDEVIAKLIEELEYLAEITLGFP